MSRSVMERRPSLERFSQQRVGWLLVGVVSIVWFGWAGRAGLGNPYYSASARTLASNPQWLLSGAFDPGGYVTVDKPPVGVWASAFGVAVTGASAIGFILPNAVLAWLAAWFTSRAVPRLSAPFVMLLVLLTPGMTVLARSSLPDATMLAAGCASAAVLLGSSRARGSAFAGALFGVAVLAKPGAVLILPAFLVLLTMRRLGGFRRGAAFFGVFLLVLGAWLVGASVTPDRPYFGGTTQDSAIELLVGADTKGRVVDADLVASGDRFVGLASAGEPGVTRTVSGRMGRQAGFLAVFALLGGLGLLRDSSAEVDRSVVAFWLTWLVVHLVVYSMLPGIAHAYYAASLGPPIAVLSVLVIREGGAGFLSALGLAASAYITFGLVQGSAVLQPRVALGLFVVGAVLAVGWAVWANSSQVAVVMVFGGVFLVMGSLAMHSLVVARVPGFDPAAGDRGAAGVVDDGALLELIGDAEERWAVATDDEALASRLVARHGSSVLLVGGFLSRDPIVTEDELGKLIADGHIGFLVGPEDSRSSAGSVLEAVVDGCEAVSVPGLVVRDCS